MLHRVSSASQSCASSRSREMGSLLQLLCLFGVSSNISGVFVILGDSFEFTATARCQKQGAELRHRLDSSRPDLVARWEGGVWTPGPGYKDRIDPNGSVALKSTNFNDNGLYELTCEETPTQLDVVGASAVSVRSGGSVSFSFLYVTSGAHGTFKLVRNSETVCEVDLSSGDITYGTGYEERLALRSDWRSTGELTPTLQVKPEDQGDYFAYVEERDGKKRSLSAWRMKVPDPDQTTATPRPPGEEKGTGIWTVTGGAVAVFVAGGLAGFGLCWWIKSRRPNVSSGPGGEGRSAHVEIMSLVKVENPAGSEDDNGPSRVHG